jgi:hypothetical protein
MEIEKTKTISQFFQWRVPIILQQNTWTKQQNQEKSK